jgi:DNA polymerase-3 subunit beta
MKVTCGREALSEAFQVASSVVPVRSTIPILQNIKVTARAGAGAGTLDVVGNDLELGVRYTVGESGAGGKTVPVEVHEEGMLVLPSSRVGGLLREGQDERVVLESEGSLATLKFQDSRYKIVGTDPADYPDLPPFDAQQAVQVPTKDFSMMIRRTLFAVSEESSRYALTGVLLDLREEDLRLVASDGKRMALVRQKAGGAGKAVKVLVPPKALQLLDRVLGAGDAEVRLQVEENQIRMQTSRAMIFSRLIEGNFPDYDQVIPGEGGTKVGLEVEPFFSAVRRAALMTSDKGRAVKFVFSRGRLRLETRAAEIGESEIELPVDYDGETVDLIFNPDYFLDVLRVVGTKKVDFEIREHGAAAVMRTPARDFTYLVMPLKIDL